MNKKYKISFALLVAAVSVARTIVYLSHANIAVLKPMGPVAAEEKRLILFGLGLSLVVVVVLILVFGTLWIMNNLNYRMTPQKINTYMQNQDNL